MIDYVIHDIIIDILYMRDKVMKKVKTYRPYTWEERDQLRGKWVKDVIFGGNHDVYQFNKY